MQEATCCNVINLRILIYVCSLVMWLQEREVEELNEEVRECNCLTLILLIKFLKGYYLRIHHDTVAVNIMLLK